MTAPASAPTDRRGYAREKRLQARRRRVIFAIRGMAHGLEDRAIRNMLDVTRTGFTNMIYREMKHCNVTTRVQLVFHYIKQGYITGDDIKKAPTHDEGLQL